MTSKKATDDLALTLKEVATDCSQAKEKLAVVKTEIEAVRLDSEDARKEAELIKNTSERLRIEAEESRLSLNVKESALVSIIKRGEDEKSPLLEKNNRLLVVLFAAENLSKKAKDESQKVRDILKPVISEANMAKEAVARAENSKLRDAFLDKEAELQFSLKEVEKVKINEAVASDNVKKLKKLFSEVEVAMGEEKHRCLSKQESTQKEVEAKVLRVSGTE
ncbi:Myosin heavy chain-related protein [Raphanus sativus]|nr:Myosin heavy chain-related protein [Raphanus sativus]